VTSSRFRASSTWTRGRAGRHDGCRVCADVDWPGQRREARRRAARAAIHQPRYWMSTSVARGASSSTSRAAMTSRWPRGDDTIADIISGRGARRRHDSLRARSTRRTATASSSDGGGTGFEPRVAMDPRRRAASPRGQWYQLSRGSRAAAGERRQSPADRRANPGRSSPGAYGRHARAPAATNGHDGGVAPAAAREREAGWMKWYGSGTAATAAPRAPAA